MAATNLETNFLTWLPLTSNVDILFLHISKITFHG